MDKKLFSEFDPVSAKAFKQKIQFDLKGADYNEKLVWHSNEGIDVKPFYHKDDNIKPLSIPGQPENWKIGEEIFILEAQASAESANEAIEKGAESILFKAEKPFDVDLLFDKLQYRQFHLYFDLQFLDADFQINLLAQAKQREFLISINLDIVGNLALTGNWFTNLEADHKAIDKIISSENGLETLSVDTSLYQNAGAFITQQLAYGLAQVNEYLNGYSDKLANTQLTFKVAIGSNYFFEIAKIRALRLLYASLAKEYKLPETCHIIAFPSKRNKVIYDYNTNLLRTTTECMSAILGGADTIINLPYDALYHKTNDFGQRISRNQLLILKEESYFDMVSNPAEGSYYIESLTTQLAEKALDIFKEIEAGGGFLKQLKEGIIQKKIKESANKEQEQFDKGTKILLGTNKHPNLSDRMEEDLELYPFVKIKPRKTLLEPIIPKRLAENLEKQRLENE